MCERLGSRVSVGPVDPRDVIGRNDVLILVPPGENHECRERANEAHHDHPPDMPDQRESHEGGEERANETGWDCFCGISISA